MAGDGTPGPVIVLVEPQLGENIGMAARAMLNCRLTELRLVKPRDGWPSDEATAAAAGADEVVEGARVFDTTADAVAELMACFPVYRSYLPEGAEHVDQLLYRRDLKAYALLVMNIARELSRRLRVADGILSQFVGSVTDQYLKPSAE